MRLLIALLIALFASPCVAAPATGALDDTWNRWMKPRSDAIEQLAGRVRTGAHRGAESVVIAAVAREGRRRAMAIGAGFLLVVLAGFGVRFYLSGRAEREKNRLRMILDASRRRDEERR